MGLADYLRTNNGLKTTQSVLNKQQSGVDAVHKASPEQINMNTAQAMLHGKEEQLTPPKDAHEQAVRMNRQTAEGMLNGSIPIVKKEEPNPETKLEPEKKQLTYAEMYKMLNPADIESPEQRAQREKNEKRKARIAAFGDGLRALADIVFASKGAKVVHNPESDMTAAINKRKAYMDAQREKNRAAWQAGYQRALALDEEARKNNLTIGEQIRHNVENEGIAKTKLDQSQQRIDINRMRITNQQEYNQARLELDRLWKENKISQGEKELAIKLLNAQANQIRANKSGGGRGSRGGSSKEDWDSEYLKLNGEHPSEVADANQTVANGGIKPNTAAGRKQVVKIVRKKIAHKGGGSSHGGGSTSNNSRAKQLAKKYGF